MTNSRFGSGDAEGEAGEYVVGTLDPDERVAFTARLREDPEARRAVAEWERHLAGLAHAVDAVAPQPETWSRIEQALKIADGKLQRFRVIEGGGQVTPIPMYIASRNRWRAAALVSGAIAAALLIFVAVSSSGILQAPTAHRTFVAAVNRGGDKPALIIRVDLDGKRVFVHPVATETPAGHSLELWYIADGGAPRSMGLVKDGSASLPIPAGVRTASDAAFAVSVEPEGGSKTGGPTGAVVYSGALVED